MDLIFCRRTHEQKMHGFTFLESMKVQKIRIQSFCKLKMLIHTQIQSVNTAKCFRKHQSHFLQTQTAHKCSFQQNVFPKEWGQALCACVGPPGSPPIFWKKTFYGKEHNLCNVCVTLRLSKMGLALSKTFGSFNTLNLCMFEHF